MKVRRYIGDEETINCEQYKELFLGDCCGVALVKRGDQDKHICFIHLTEDDGHWSPRGGIMSSFWIAEEIEVLKAVQEWLQKNAEPDMYNGNQFGWIFKTDVFCP